MLHVVESKKSIQQIAEAFPEVATRHQFGVLGTHNLRQKMNDKGVPFDRECLVFEVCNPQQARKVLEGNMAISTALPCRVSVYQEGGKTKIATIKPTALLAMFPAEGLKTVAEEVERDLLAIIRELA